MTLFGLCDLLAKESYLLARVEVDALPGDFVPGYSVQDTVAKIRQQHSNCESLVAELEGLCRERLAAGATCPFSRKPASGTAREDCPYLAILARSITSFAEKKAQEAFTEWSRRRQHNGHGR